MLPKSLTLLTSALVSAALAGSPIAAQAGGVSHIGTWGGRTGGTPRVGTLNCPPGGQRVPGITTINNTLNVYKPITSIRNVDVNNNININKSVNVYKPVTNIKNINVDTNINANKNIDIYKPVTITKNIDNSKNININKNIDNSKNININKNIVINKGGGDSSAEAAAVASAMAAAMASASSSASAVINFNGGNASAGSESFASAFGYSGSGAAVGGGSYIAEAPGPSPVGDIGPITVEAPVAACTIQEATVIKAIHAVCVSADNHEFPASHMVPDTWIESSYEGEIARCLPGSRLRVTVGAVFQSSEGMASSWTHGQTLECGPHEAVRHYKGGMLKCAPAVPVPDCTERTNLRKYGTADMFFTYRARVCMETHQEYSENDSRTNMSREDDLRGYSRSGY
ncbi:MAG: hypothetical protein BGN85_05060 [Alphaproteobacteria bacterium 64-11]|nr:hypothetical protein [Alphaproteobacteria bacterium]OJU09318.1 MAG: hypothetical protein BGN85_05060 [Alphaproteobacteria bacterium 64-11]